MSGGWEGVVPLVVGAIVEVVVGVMSIVEEVVVVDGGLG